MFLRGVAQQRLEGTGLQPEVAQWPEVPRPGPGQAQQRGVDAARAGAGQHVDGDGGVQQFQQTQIQGLGPLVAAGGVVRLGQGIVLLEGVAPPGRLLEQVQLAGHAAHPDRQAHAAGHRRGDPQLLGSGSELCRIAHVQGFSRAARRGRTRKRLSPDRGPPLPACDAPILWRGRFTGGWRCTRRSPPRIVPMARSSRPPPGTGGPANRPSRACILANRSSPTALGPTPTGCSWQRGLPAGVPGPLRSGGVLASEPELSPRHHRPAGLSPDVIAELIAEVGSLWHDRHQDRLVPRPRRRGCGGRGEAQVRLRRPAAGHAGESASWHHS